MSSTGLQFASYPATEASLASKVGTPANRSGADSVEADQWTAESLGEWSGDFAGEQPRSQRRKRGIRLTDVAEFTAQLAIMIRSGVDAATALGSLASQCQRPALAEVLHRVHDSVLSGSTLSESLRRQQGVFDASYVATIAAGEASGSLAEVLGQLAHMQRLEVRNSRTMRTLLTYPILLFAVSSTVIVALVIFVLPRFADIFAQYGVALPSLTQMLISLASELRSRWWLWLPLGGSAIVGFLVWRRTPTGREMLDSFWLNTALIQDVVRARLTGRMCRMLGIMLTNGVPLLESLKLTRSALNNAHYQALMTRLEDSITNGRNLGSVLQTADVVPRSAREMIITAESTGNLGEVTQLLGEYYEEEAEARMRQFVGFLEPALTVGMGAVVAVVVLAVMLPVFDLSGLAKNSP